MKLINVEILIFGRSIKFSSGMACPNEYSRNDEKLIKMICGFYPDCATIGI